MMELGHMQHKIIVYCESALHIASYPAFHSRM